MSLSSYLWNVALATDIEINTIFGGERPAGPQATISLRAAVAAHYYSGYKKWLGTVMCAFLSWFEKDHCATTLEVAAAEGKMW